MANRRDARNWRRAGLTTVPALRQPSPLVVVFASSLTNPIRECPDQQGLRRPVQTPGTCETSPLGLARKARLTRDRFCRPTGPAAHDRVGDIALVPDPAADRPRRAFTFAQTRMQAARRFLRRRTSTLDARPSRCWIGLRLEARASRWPRLCSSWSRSRLPAPVHYGHVSVFAVSRSLG